MNTRALAELIAQACRSGGDRLIRFFDEQGKRQVRNPADHPLAFLLAEAIGDVPPGMADEHQISYVLNRLERDAADLNAVVRRLRRAAPGRNSRRAPDVGRRGAPRRPKAAGHLTAME